MPRAEGERDEMSNISLASKVAIAFLKPFRSYLDGRNKILEKRKDIEQEVREKTDLIAESTKKYNPHISEERLAYAKEGFIAINMHLVDTYDKCYDKVLPEVIDLLTMDLEKELKKSFTNDELRHLIDILADPALKKLLENKDLFGLLKKCEFLLEHKLKLQTMYSSVEPEEIVKITDMLRGLRDRFNIKDDRENIDPEGDEENFWQDE
jgi:hypothetical protein